MGYGISETRKWDGLGAVKFADGQWGAVVNGDRKMEPVLSLPEPTITILLIFPLIKIKISPETQRRS